VSHPAVTGRRPVLPGRAARAAAVAYAAALSGAAGNVALFAPLGFLPPLLAPRLDQLGRTVAAGFLLSLAIALSQVAFPGVRRADVNDVLMNTLGTALGFLAWRLAARRRA
jgi:glycopeptide antibiotics resistance protein